MITQGAGAIINIILDPILIFGYFGMPKMGVAGAAVATVIGQCTAAVMAIIMNIRVNTEIHVGMKGFKPSGSVIRQIYIIGVPSIVMQAIGSVMTYGMNRILLSFTSTATTAKPFPCSPALAASMEAFRARILRTRRQRYSVYISNCRALCLCRYLA